MSSQRLLRVLVLCLVAGLLMAVSGVALAQEEPAPTAEEGVAVVDDEGTRPLPRDADQPIPAPVPGPEDPAIVIAPAGDRVVEPAPAPTEEQRVISPGGETIGIEESEGVEWDMISAGIGIIAGLIVVGALIFRVLRMRHHTPLTH